MKKQTRRRKSDALPLASKADSFEKVSPARDISLALLDTFPAPMWRSGTDAKYDWVNASWLQFTGRTMKEELGDGWSTGVHPDDLDGCLKTYLTAFGARQPFEMEYRLRRHDGEYRWIVDTGKPFSDNAGHFAGYIGSCYDITRHKVAEHALRESEEKFRALAETVPEIIFTNRPDGSCDFVNHRLYECTGLPLGSGEGFGWAAALHPDDAERSKARWLEAVRMGMPYEDRYRFRSPDGTYRWFMARSRPITNSQGQTVKWCGVSINIDDLARAEEALRKSEERLDLALAATSEGVWDWDLTSGHVLFSPRWLESLGYSPGDLEPHVRSWECLVHPDDMPRVMDALTAHLEGWTPVYTCENRLLTKSATYRWNLDKGKVVARDANGKPLRMVGTDTDITERKQAEAALNARAHQQAAVATIGRLALLGVDLKTLMDEAVDCVARTLEVELCKVLELLPDRHSLLLRAGVGWKDGYVGSATVGVEQDSQAGYTLLQDAPVIVEDLRTETRFTGPAFLDDHGVVSGMSVVIARDKGPFGVLGAHTMRPRLFTQEDADFLQSVANVIGDAIVRKCTEEALRESQRQHLALLSNLPGMAYRCRNDRDWTMEFVSDGCFDLTGYAARDLLHNRNVTYGKLIHSDDQEWLWKTCQDSLKKKEPCKNEYRIIHATGQVKWVWEQTHGIYSESGELIAIEGFITDVTERKEVERGLQDKTAQLEAITESFSAYLETGNWHAASTMIIRSALELTNSEYAFIGVLVNGPALRILAHAGMSWDKTINRSFYEKALRTYQDVGYLEFTNFENLFGKVITTGRAVLSNDPSSDSRSGGLPPGHPPLRCFLGVPILRGNSVVGMIGVANRTGGYAGAEQEQIKILTQAAGVLYESYRQREREVSLETAREQAEEALRGSEERFRQFADTVNEVFWMNELQPRRVIYVNSAFERVWGYSVQSLYDNPRLWEESIHPDDRMRAHEAFEQWILGEAQARLDLDYRIIRPDGHIRWIQDRGVKILDAHKRPSCFAGVAADITERKQVEEALREREQQLLQALDEREAISEDLHDGVLQSLYAVGLGLENGKLLLNPNPASALEQMDQAIAQLNGVMREVRHFIVRPDAQLTRRPDLDRTLEDLISKLVQTHPIKIKLSVDPSAAARLTRNEAVHVAYIVQEALSNSVRHGSAHTGEISLGWRGHAVHLEISDDGVGFDLESVRGRGHGLGNMASRAQKLTGRLQISSNPGQGTRISLTLNGNT